MFTHKYSITLKIADLKTEKQFWCPLENNLSTIFGRDIYHRRENWKWIWIDSIYAEIKYHTEQKVSRPKRIFIKWKKSLKNASSTLINTSVENFWLSQDFSILFSLRYFFLQNKNRRKINFFLSSILQLSSWCWQMRWSFLNNFSSFSLFLFVFTI